MQRMPTVDELIERFHMVPLSGEGGMKFDSYQSDELLPRADIPGRAADRPMGSAILYLLTPGTFSRMHRLKSDEIFHFYLGASCEMLLLYPDGRGERVRLGSDLLAGDVPQVVVPRGTWQGTRIVGEGEFALMGCSMAPAYHDDDYENGTFETLSAQYPAFREPLAVLCGAPKYR